MKSERGYKFLIFVFKLTGGPNDDIMESYCNEEQLMELGLDPSKDIDIKLDHKGYHLISINLFTSKYKDKFTSEYRDLLLGKLLGDL